MSDNERIVMQQLENVLDEHCPVIAYSELPSMTKIPSKILRGVMTSLIKKGLVTSYFDNDAKVSFIGLTQKRERNFAIELNKRLNQLK